MRQRPSSAPLRQDHSPPRRRGTPPTSSLSTSRSRRPASRRISLLRLTPLPSWPIRSRARPSWLALIHISEPTRPEPI
eukprot:5522925-Pyramimonas_sp.AAC.1